MCTKLGGSGNSRRRRPKLRWCDELEKDVTRAECRNWRINAQSREEWRNLIEEIKSHEGDVVPVEEEEIFRACFLLERKRCCRCHFELPRYTALPQIIVLKFALFS